MANTINSVITFTEFGLKQFKSTPALSNMLPNSIVNTLKVGDNNIQVNPTSHGKLQRMFGDNCHSQTQYTTKKFKLEYTNKKDNE